MNSEITDTSNQNGWVCFDAECSFCVRLARQFGPLLHRHNLALLPLQTPWVKEMLARTGKEVLEEMRLISTKGEIRSGGDALAEIARHIWWAKPIYWMSRVWPIKSFLRASYRLVARNRNCKIAGCPIPSHRERHLAGIHRWIPLLVLLLLAFGLGRKLSNWILMWTVATALFFGAKWVTISRLLASGSQAGLGRLLAYAFLWPGMNARAFCCGRPVLAPVFREWVLAALKIILGAAALSVGVTLAGKAHPVIAGWIGMIGLVLFLHFGFFHLLSNLWRSAGINAQPVMRSPIRATSLGAFWSGRWNSAFADLMHENVFAPLAQIAGPRAAIFLTFLISGLLHELVISAPARGGYGLPTAYFCVQGFALLFEHSRAGRRIGIGSGFKGWCFVVLIAAAPAYVLFNPVFIRKVVLPMLHAF